MRRSGWRRFGLLLRFHLAIRRRHGKLPLWLSLLLLLLPLLRSCQTSTWNRHKRQRRVRQPSDQSYSQQS